jgi:hypothetical protein
MKRPWGHISEVYWEGKGDVKEGNRGGRNRMERGKNQRHLAHLKWR